MRRIGRTKQNDGSFTRNENKTKTRMKKKFRTVELNKNYND